MEQNQSENHEAVANEKKKKETHSFKFSDIFKGKESPSNHQKSFIQKVGIQNLCILLILGVLLIAFCYFDSTDGKKKGTQTLKSKEVAASLDANPIYSDSANESDEYTAVVENKLKEILSKVKGIGDVDVMITLAESKELVTLKDSPYTQDSVNENDGEGGSRITSNYTREDTTVMSSTTDGETIPYIIKEIEPVIEGVLVIADGGADAQIELEIVEAIEALFDIPVHKIKVMEKDPRK